MAESRKRAVAVARRVADDAAEEEGVSDNYALRLTQALEAISAAQSGEGDESATYTRRGFSAASSASKDDRPSTAAPKRKSTGRPAAQKVESPRTASATTLEQPGDSDERWLADALDKNDTFAALLSQAVTKHDVAPTEPATSSSPTGLKAFLAALDRLPPIRLPIGPAIPWKVGLPALVALVIVMSTFGRSAGSADAQGVQLPAQQTYQVQQEAPLFANSAQQAQAQPTQAPVGVPEPAAASGFDFFDIVIKLGAVLGLAYGSLMLLKKFGMGGANATKAGSGATGLKIVSSLVLAPNRTVHLISVPGGKSLLVGVTPNQVNLIAELGEVELETATADGASFLDVLSSKLGK